MGPEGPLPCHRMSVAAKRTTTKRKVDEDSGVASVMHGCDKSRENVHHQDADPLTGIVKVKKRVGFASREIATPVRQCKRLHEDVGTVARTTTQEQVASVAGEGEMFSERHHYLGIASQAAFVSETSPINSKHRSKF